MRILKNITKHGNIVRTKLTHLKAFFFSSNQVHGDNLLKSINIYILNKEFELKENVMFFPYFVDEIEGVCYP